MTKFTKLALVALFGMAMVTTTASAGDAAKGLKLYSKKLKEACEMSGADFAKKHTTDEWTAIIEEGKMADEIKAICGDDAEIKEKLVPFIGDFAVEYSSDSGNVPSC
ncbi:cytochrome C [bacterium]|nr:cytochrome C [bacterium]MBU1958991.1 cytochrome C [bacterium]